MPPPQIQQDVELIALADETRRVADSIEESAIRVRLIEIANEILELAHAQTKSY
jgi:replicative DNA helicase